MKLPRKVWVLLPSFKPKEVEITAFTSDHLDNWYLTATGRAYRERDVYDSKQDAIDGGFELLDAEQAKQEKALLKLEKRRDALLKAEEEGE